MALTPAARKDRERARDQRRRADGRKTDVGYGHSHRQLRKRWKPLVDAGLVACARCKRPIVPGEPWDLGHVDGSRTLYQGPEHIKCNRGTAAKDRRKPAPALPRASRRW